MNSLENKFNENLCMRYQKKYDYAEDIVWNDVMGVVEANSKIKINVNSSEKFEENSMMLYYIDKENKRHEETIIGYFEMGYSGKATIEINSIDEVGMLGIKGKEEF